jgi:hypothetical protein
MITSMSDAERPPTHLGASQANRLFARLALRLAHHQLAIAAMLLEEIEGVELSDPQSIPPGPSQNREARNDG